MITSLKVANYKNIGDSFIGFDNIEKFNILIGRNNIGKSILLSVLHKLKNIYFYNDGVELFDDSTLIEYSIRINDIPRELFGSDRPIGGFESYQAYGKSLLNKTIVYEYHMMDRLSHIKKLDDSLIKPFGTQAIDNDIKKILEDLGQSELKSFTNNFNLIKLNADRNLLPEMKSTSLKVDANGSGATNFIRAYLHNSKYDFKVVEKEMLEALNKIVLPDEHFDRIMCQEIVSDDETKWEIHLVNENGRIPLSSSGSGLRTILLVLIKLFLANRNSILVMDSDKKQLNGRINKTKQRIIKEFTDSGSIAWVTKGKEIENYLSRHVIKEEYGINKQIGQFECIGEFLNKGKKNSKYGDKYTSNKYNKSIDLVKHMTLEDINVLDLKEKIEQIVLKIKKWNYIQ